jgi:3-deoxy-manno-octulosonate cytidylyltransferase (CMP-KDO synthetase)
MNIRTIALIPARLTSTRLPRKVLADIHGHPLIWHVWSRVCQAKEIDKVMIATDSPEVADVATGFGAQVIMTSPDCQSGTERIASVIDQLAGDLILNVQGDEPLVDPGMLDALVAKWKTTPCDLITPVYRIHEQQDLVSPNVVKVIRAADGRALYFSRSVIPHLRDFPFDSWLEHAIFWGHIGVYGYRREILAHYYELPQSPLERLERLEQLRFLEAGYSIQTVETEYQAVSVDVLEDLERVRQMVGENNHE